MGQTYTCNCKLENPTTLSEEVASARHKIVHSKESLSVAEADSLGDFIAQHDPYFNVPGAVFSDEEILNRLHCLDFNPEIKSHLAGYFRRNSEALSNVTNFLNSSSRHRYSTNQACEASQLPSGEQSPQIQRGQQPMQTVVRQVSSPIPIHHPVALPMAVHHPMTEMIYSSPNYMSYPPMAASAVLPPVTTAVTTHTMEPRSYMYTSYTPVTRYTTQYIPMTTATTQYAPQTQCYTTYQPASYTTYTSPPHFGFPAYSPYPSVTYF